MQLPGGGLFTRLNAQLLGRNTWPPPGQADVWAAIEFWGALRRSDEARIKQQASVPWWRKYLISPVPRMISRSKANLLYGEPAEIRPETDADEKNLERIVDENGLQAELHRAALIASSEREVWGRIQVDPTLLDVPIISFTSRRNVIPHFRGRFVAGATFITEWREGKSTVYRMLETYTAGAVETALWQGNDRSLGVQLSLDAHPETQGRQEQILTGIDYPLCAFIPNSIDADPAAGFGDYQGLEERFLAINEAATIGQENMRLVGKKRALVDTKYMRNGRLPAGDDIYVRSEAEATAGDSGKPLQLLEYSLEAEPTVAWIDSLIDTTLVFGGTSPQYVGRSVDGGTISGTALKLKMTHSLMEASGTGGFFDRGVRRLLRAAAVIDSRPTTQGGFGRRWSTPDEDPSVERGDGLPADDMEAAQWVVLAAGADAISTPEKVRFLHPDWKQEQIDEEVAAIEEKKKAMMGNLPQIPTNRPPTPFERPEGDPAAGETGAPNA